MRNENRQLDRVEKLLVGLRAAEDAGVFKRTPANARKVLSEAGHHAVSVGYRNYARLFAPAVAASVVLAIGLGGWMLSTELSSIRVSRGLSRGTVVATASANFAAFQQCLGGPNRRLSGDCADHDYQTDGHVDLADFSALQVAYAGEPR